MDLPDKASASPARLLGGQKQRVAPPRAQPWPPGPLVLENSLSDEQSCLGLPVPFVASLVLVAVGMAIRLSVEDGPEVEHVDLPRPLRARPAAWIGPT